MLRNRYPHGVKFHLVKDKDGDTAINPPQDDITCNTADENVERTNTPLQSSQHHGDKKSSYNGQWTEEDMECAMKDVEDNSYSIRAAGKKWGIPASTLAFWLSGLTTTKRRGIASILRLAGYGEAQVEECLEQCVKQMKKLEAQQTEEPTESTCSLSHISQTQYENGIHEDFSLPSQFEQPNWIKEGAEHLGIQIDMENEEVSLSMPSPPMLSFEVIHYYADTMDWENSNLETNEVAADEQDGHNQSSLKTTATFEIEDEAEEILCSQGSLKFFLKLPIERVRNRKKEARKAEIEELKVRKKKQKEARKLEQIARRKRKDEEKLERQIIKQRKEEERAQQQKERELKKKQKQMGKQKKPAKEQVNEDVAIIVGERSTPSTPLPQHHQILQDMYNILTPTYAALSNLQAGYHNNLEHTAIRAGHNSTPSTPLPGHHQILRDMYNILTPAYAALNNIHVPTSHSPPHSPIKQFQFGGVLDENIFGSITPITPQVDAAIAEKTMTRSPMEEPDAAIVEKMITRRPVEEPEPFPGFMVN
ncbi:hypothetical protein SUGI_0254260 [Cryptomeria japonica]|nr:hypothetical protein SUGI_0254260 [Cryptomeria japonica]